ncbi:MAG TPA: carboxypeptidase regulatory-like domain-containing protein [Terriglobia bacterium]|nr:carboxypeptidase regulatory-like domain-containing protein [Terriglobia bacterium]
MRETLRWILILTIPLGVAVQIGLGLQRGAGARGQRGARGGAPGNPTVTPSPGTPERGRGRGQPNNRPPTSVNGGSVQGVVLRADTNETLSRARIDLVRADWAPPGPTRQVGPRGGAAPRQPAATSPPLLTATTDEQGRFQFDNIEPGRYTLRAARNQFVRQDYGQRGRNELGTLIVVERGEQVTGIVLRLYLAPTISGRVTDPLGQPMAAATIAAYRLEYGPSGRSLTLAKATLSDDRGEYRLFWLTPGDYYLVAGYGAQVSKPLAENVSLTPNLPEEDQAYTVVYYPGTTNIRDAEIIRLSAGLDSFRDVHFMETQRYTIRGRVVDASTYRAVSGASVFLLLGSGHTGGREPDPIRADSDGRFTINGAAAGTYILYATAEPTPQALGGNRNVLGPRLFSELHRINLTEDLDGIVIPMAPPVEITGRVRFEGILADREGPIDGVRSLRELDGVVVTLTRKDGGVGDPRSSALSADGSFTILEVPPGTYTVSAPVPLGFYIKGIRYSGRDALSAGLTIRNVDPRSGSLDIVFGPGSSIDGRILDRGNAVAGAQIVLVPDPRWDTARSPDRFKITATDTTGSFYLRGIAPGRYLAFAFEELENRFYFDPEFLNRFGVRGVPVQLEENGIARPDLTLITAAETEAFSR